MCEDIKKIKVQYICYWTCGVCGEWLDSCDVKRSLRKVHGKQEKFTSSFDLSFPGKNKREQAWMPYWREFRKHAMGVKEGYNINFSGLDTKNWEIELRIGK